MECKNRKDILQYLPVNVKNKKILLIKVTDEHFYDNKAISRLVENIIKSDSMAAAIGKLFADGVYMMVMIFLDVLETMELCRALQ